MEKLSQYSDSNIPSKNADGASLSHQEGALSYTVTKAYDTFTMGSEGVPGTPLFEIPLSPEITEETRLLAQRAEFWSIGEITLDLAATSSMGLSSGSMQVGYVTDPYNVYLDPAELQKNIDKLVRQDGSVTVRPRDTITTKIEPSGIRYTNPAGDLRFHNIGGYAGVLRTIPNAGDTVSWACTFKATYTFSRRTYIPPENPLFTGDALVTLTPHHGETKITVATADHDSAPISNITFLSPLTAKLNGTERTISIIRKMVIQKPGLYSKVVPFNIPSVLTFHVPLKYAKARYPTCPYVKSPSGIVM